MDAGDRGTVSFPMLRQQTAKPEGGPNRCLADCVAPEGATSVGSR